MVKVFVYRFPMFFFKKFIWEFQFLMFIFEKL